MQLVFLGTSAMVPTKERNHSAVFLSYLGEGILFDCGEGTQRQFKIAGIPMTKVTKVLISHWHGDHVLGLPGLIQSLAASEYSGTLEIYGPRGTKEHIARMFEAFVFDQRINLKVVEVSQGVFFRSKKFRLEAMPLKHKVPCLGYAFVEEDRRRINIDFVKKLGIPEGPLLGELQDGRTITFKGRRVTPEEATYVVRGKKIAVIWDTALCENAFKLARNADVLVCEASYSADLADKAEEYMHLTALSAGQIASQSGVKKLVLTHFSARYKTTGELESEARTAFENVFAAKDFLKLNI